MHAQSPDDQAAWALTSDQVLWLQDMPGGAWGEVGWGEEQGVSGVFGQGADALCFPLAWP